MEQMKRLAFMYSDGSMGVFEDTAKLEKVLADAAEADPNETDPAHFVRVAEIEIAIVTDHGVPRLEELGASRTIPGSAIKRESTDKDAARAEQHSAAGSAVAVPMDRFTSAGPGPWWFIHHPDGFLIECGEQGRAEQITREINAGRAVLTPSEPLL